MELLRLANSNWSIVLVRESDGEYEADTVEFKGDRKTRLSLYIVKGSKTSRLLIEHGVASGKDELLVHGPQDTDGFLVSDPRDVLERTISGQSALLLLLEFELRLRPGLGPRRVSRGGKGVLPPYKLAVGVCGRE
ncbi:hypothetical protein FACS189449_08880 [Alphaproteobacteria bacterium]|nr:hypothetical protein FACS189449_08880 [Alphaproteobacteria bacterium]